MASTDVGWREIYEHGPGGSEHPEELAQRRQYAARDAERRARLPEWEAELPRAEAVVAEKQAVVDAARAALDAAYTANAAKYRRVVQGRGIRDPRLGEPIHWLDDPRCEPELGKRKLAEQVLTVAISEHGQAAAWRDHVNAECCFIKGTVPAR